MNRTKLIYTYSLIKTLYEQGKDYIDTFVPFVLKIMPGDKSPLSLDSIGEGTRENFGLDIPEHSLQTIVTRAKRRGYIVQQRRQCRLTDQGNDYIDSLEPEPEVERRINELLEDIKDYLNEQLRLSLSLNETHNVVLSFIHENIEVIIEFLNPASSITQLNILEQRMKECDRPLIDYFEIAKAKKPGLYKTLTDIVYGSLIGVAASDPDIAEINKKFGDIQIFLDSNYLLSVLGLHFDEFNRPAIELFDLLKVHRFKLMVFDFTIDEMVKVLMNYPREQGLYIPGIHVDSIYSILKSQGWTTEDMKKFVSKIEDRIWGLGAKIEPTTIDLQYYKPSNQQYRTKLSQYKPEQSLQSQNHDLAAIETIRKIRRSPRRKIEESRALFLTSDLRLARFDFIEMAHKDRATVCEVIPDQVFTNILWLKNPTIAKDIPLKSIVAVHSREMFINRRIWRRFCENLKNLRDEGRISNTDIAMLLYGHHIEEVLKTYASSQIEEITPEFILRETEKVSKRIAQETKRAIKEQREIFEIQLGQKEQKFELRLHTIKENVKAKAIEKAKKLAMGGIFIPVLISGGILAYFLLVKGWILSSQILLAITSVTGFLSFLGIKINLLNIQKYLQDKIFQRTYRKSLSELSLEEHFDNLPPSEKQKL